MKSAAVFLIYALCFYWPSAAYAEVSDKVSDTISTASISEVIQKTPTRVVVREHPRTGKPYVSITSSETPDRDLFSGLHQAMKRPDYRMLDPKIKPGKIPYEGPYSDRKKVYILAASLATVGAVGGAAGMALAPAATGSGAAGGAGLYAAGGVAVVAGTAAGTVALTKTDPDQDDFTHESEAKLKEL